MAKDGGGVLRKVRPSVRPAAGFAYSQLNTAAIQLLSCTGFQGASANACAVLAELIQRYVQLLARTSADFAQSANRVEETAWDIECAVNHIMGEDAFTEVHEWADDENIWKRDSQDWVPEAIGEQCKRLAKQGARPLPVVKETFTYEQLSSSMLAELEIRRAAHEAMDEGVVWDDAPSDAFATSVLPPVSGYIPAFLPALPDMHAEHPALALMEEDEEERKPAILHHAMQKKRLDILAPTGDVNAKDRDGVRRVWRRRAAEYNGVLSEESNARNKLPSIEAFHSMQPSASESVDAAPRHMSSLDAFLHAAEELTDDPTVHSPLYLTSLARSHHVNPNSSAFIDGAFKRRRLAHCFADPLRYMPNDSVHGCVNVHPASPSYAPGPSLLITIPDAKEGHEEDITASPVFTPVHPHGRAVTMNIPSGALYPSLSYRFPPQLYAGVRLVTVPTLQRVFSRSADPPALLDDHHTERVFHGMSASRTLMTGTMMSVQNRDSTSAMVNRYRGGNSVLHASLERLRFSLAAQLAAQRQALKEHGKVDELDEEPIRGERIKMPTSGTLVYSWNWQQAMPWASS
ncbi:hypothetical protein MVES1_001966 [Malassezia vespertilionis]|uniref:Bromodomain associated domain-containing protein n=1 Tax=Malassezia vespertilionis TaxID=2020962 RepID=A0A2N1JBN8_9BASI|nr:uncharacterized protein MVES1_001966 [Malassezia vespertilionis]PKI83958.1 hypothetical protein MVES_001862 [Malassezia vespertilionis]WFD06612.1 hypothetical protein MVES1_001966 [Malassezia vespertilionis]